MDFETTDLDSFYAGYDDYCERIEKENNDDSELDEIDYAYEQFLDRELGVL